MLVLWGTGRGRRARLPSRQVLALLVLCFAAWALDGLNSFAAFAWKWRFFYQSSNESRLITGMLMGLALGTVFYPVFHFCMWKDAPQERIAERAGELLLPFAVGGVITTLILALPSAPYWLWVTTVTIAVASVFALLNATLVVLLLQREGRAQTWRDLLPYLTLGLLASLLETGAVAVARRLLMI